MTLKKILHIDDDTVMRMMVKKSLERSIHQFAIISCATSNEFINLLMDFKPDLLLMDVIMPQMTGPELLFEVRKMTLQMPAIFMTGQEGLTIDAREKLEPIIGVIQKPFSPTSLGEDLIRLWTMR